MKKLLFGGTIVTLLLIIGFVFDMGSKLDFTLPHATLVYKSSDSPEDVPRVMIESFEGKHNQYNLWDSEDQLWRRIMLPSTTFGSEYYEYIDKEWQYGGTVEGKEGYATVVDAFDDRYCKAVTIYISMKANDGNYLVLKRSPGSEWGQQWTIWTSELWEKVARMQGLS